MSHKMLEEREKARAATDLKHALACFMLNWRGAIRKIKDIRLDLLSTTSSSEEKPVKLLKFGITQDECTNMIYDQVIFLSARGLQQGDPISPMLFAIVREVLNSLIREADRRGALSPLPDRAISHCASLCWQHHHSRCQLCAANSSLVWWGFRPCH
jgi:hypothetical protein